MRNIIITGGELFNKGAQAMVFITVDEMKKRFPDHEIYLLSEMDLRRPDCEKNLYAFHFLGWYPLKFAKCQSNAFLRFACMIKNGKELAECESIYRNCDLMIDISGYGLGSVWGRNQLLTYVNNVKFAKAFSIPIYLMPQSFGPFDFEEQGNKDIGDRVPGLLSSVKVICARERDGYDALVKTYQLNNVQLKPDLVLNNRGFTISNIFKVPPKYNLPEIAANSVGIIPNGKAFELKNKESLLQLYKALITRLIRKGKNVYLLNHATSDKKFCIEIKTMFLHEEKLVFLEEDFSCIEFNEMVKKFDFLIASRFHSIVHAYKNGIPCISLGWAVKYRDLLTDFGQGRYAFDVCENISQNALLDELEYLDQHRGDESAKIVKRLQDVQKNDVFDIIQI